MTLDEELSEAVRKFKCLYDKSKKGHHDKNMIKNCWRQVAETVGCKDADEAEHLFSNLKKRYNKARKAANCGTGSSRKTAENNNKKLDELSYLSWLTPYIQLRGTRTNFKAMAVAHHTSSRNISSEHDTSESENESVQTKDTEILLRNTTLLGGILFLP